MNVVYLIWQKRSAAIFSYVFWRSEKIIILYKVFKLRLLWTVTFSDCISAKSEKIPISRREVSCWSGSTRIEGLKRPLKFTLIQQIIFPVNVLCGLGFLGNSVLEKFPKYLNSLANTGENVQKWTRVFSTRRWVILVTRMRRKKRRK